MPSEPHLPRIDDTTGYWFTRWYSGSKRKGKTFGHSAKVTKREAITRFKNWLIQRSFAAPKNATGNLLATLIEAYNEHARTYYCDPLGTPTGEHVNIKYALEPLAALFGRRDVADLKPWDLQTYIQDQIKRGAVRSTINKRLGIIKRMYGWAVQGGYVQESVYGALLTVKSIKKGRTGAKEAKPIHSPPLRDVVATMKHLAPCQRNMVKLAWLTGMRPGEICGLTPGQIDRSRKTWLYVPPRHKTAYRKKIRVIPFGPKARKLLEPYLFRDEAAYCFTPEESRRWWNEQRRKNAAAAVPTERLKERYDLLQKFDAKTFGDAIERAAIKAGVPVWRPNQLRHAAATRTDRSEGRDMARIMLGHTHAKTTEIYITEDMRRLMALAEKAG